MRRMTITGRLLASLVALMTGASATAQQAHVETRAWRMARALDRGVNLDDWLEAGWLGSSYPDSAHFTRADVEMMARLGFRTIRLPVLYGWLAADTPPYQLDTITPNNRRAIGLVDSVVRWAGANGMRVIIDHHHGKLADSNATTEAQRIGAIWAQVARRYATVSADSVLFEIYNEPTIAEAAWRNAALTIVDSIRSVDRLRTIVVGPTWWNGIGSLATFEPLPDTNIIYTVHDYEPMLFTHQGADFAGAIGATTGVPFPYGAFPMPPISPATAGDSWARSEYDDYATIGTTGAVRSTLFEAYDWSQTHDRPVFLGEFGVYQGADFASKVRWLGSVAGTLDSLGIPWAHWGWSDEFGIFQHPNVQPRPDDLIPGITEALGLHTSTSTVAAAGNGGNAGIRVNGIAPCPLAGTGLLSVTLGRAAHLTATLVDDLGRMVARIDLGEHPAGEQSIPLDVTGLPRGVYYCAIDADGDRRATAMIVGP